MPEEKKLAVKEIFGGIRDCQDKIRSLDKEINRLWKCYSDTVVEEQEKLRVLLKGVLPDCSILFRKGNVLARGEFVEAHFIWPESVKKPAYRVGFFMRKDKTQIEIELGDTFEGLLEWVSNQLLREMQNLS